MRVLDIYLARSVLVGVLVALFMVVAIDWLGDLFYQTGKMDEEDRFATVFILSLLDVPHKLIEFLPSSLLIGALLSLGQFAANSELVAVSAGGYSRLRVGLVSCAVSLVVIFIISILVELYVPLNDKFTVRLQKQNNAMLVASDDSYWVSDQQKFVRIGHAISQNLLRDIFIYSFDDQGDIEWIGQAEQAIRREQTWEFSNFRSSRFAQDKVEISNEDIFEWKTGFLSRFLQSVNTDPFKLSIKRLSEYISYLQENHLDATVYYMALLKKISVPVTGLAMMLLALPLVFRPRQLGGIGQRLFFGAIIALLSYVMIEAITNAVLVYQISPFIGTFLPAGVMLLLATLAFRFIR